MPQCLPVISTFVLGDYQTNCFVVQPDATASECWIVDCGYEPQEMLEFVVARRLRPLALLLTHCHSDHIAGIDEALARLGPMPMYVHRAEAGFCSDPLLNLSALGGEAVSVTEPDHVLSGGEELTLGEGRWRVLHAPGHSPGGVIFVHDDSLQAICGDVIFAGSIGRIDLPTSNPAAMARTLRDVVLKLPDALTLHPGHGPSTTVARERATNPYLRNIAALR